MDPFDNPHKPKERSSSYEFVAPTKEDATTGKFMCAGDYYGSGFKQPVGTKDPEYDKPSIPWGVHHMDPNDL